MPSQSDDGTFLVNPKWLVAGVAIAAFAMVASYDLRLGLAVGALLGVVLAVWLYLAVRYGSLSGAPSGRNALAAKVRVQEANRRVAADHALRRSGAQQSADPAKRP
jgi:hypothetical protein